MVTHYAIGYSQLIVVNTSFEVERCFNWDVCRLGVKPNCYVSYQTANEPWTCTEIVENSNDPVWCHENDCRLSTDLLKSDNSVRCLCNVMSNILIPTYVFGVLSLYWARGANWLHFAIQV